MNYSRGGGGGRGTPDLSEGDDQKGENSKLKKNPWGFQKTQKNPWAKN